MHYPCLPVHMLGFIFHPLRYRKWCCNFSVLVLLWCYVLLSCLDCRSRVCYFDAMPYICPYEAGIVCFFVNKVVKPERNPPTWTQSAVIWYAWHAPSFLKIMMLFFILSQKPILVTLNGDNSVIVWRIVILFARHNKNKHVMTFE